MTDLELTRLCAQAMGLVRPSPYHLDYAEDGARLVARMHRDSGYDGPTSLCIYDPLHDDAQAMPLLRYLCGRGIVRVHGSKFEFRSTESGRGSPPFEFVGNMLNGEDQRRAIVECVAKIKVAHE